MAKRRNTDPVLNRSLDTHIPSDTPAMAAMRATRRNLMSESAELGLYAGRYALVEDSAIVSVVEHKGEIRFHPSIADRTDKDRADLLRVVLTAAIARGFGN
jgi:hypothetical protein